MVQCIIKIDSGEPDEYAIIELQGELLSKNDTSMAGSFIGDLHYLKDKSPVLIIGHHILFGKCVNFDKPLAVLIKSKTHGHVDISKDKLEDDEFKNSTEYTVKAIVRKKLLFKTRPKPIIANAGC